MTKHNVIIGTRHFLQEKQRRFDSKSDDLKRRKKRRLNFPIYVYLDCSGTKKKVPNNSIVTDVTEK